MNNTVVRIDKKGRLVIPKKLRKELEIEDCYVEVRAEGDKKADKTHCRQILWSF